MLTEGDHDWLMVQLENQRRRALVRQAAYLIGVAVLYAAAVALVMFLALATQGFFRP